MRGVGITLIKELSFKVQDKNLITTFTFYLHLLALCLLLCSGDSQLQSYTALLSPPQPVRNVVSDISVPQLLLHLLFYSKQSLTSVHLCCCGFGDCRVDVYVFHSAVLGRSTQPPHPRRLMSKLWSWGRKQQNKLYKHIRRQYTSNAINRLLYYQTEVHLREETLPSNGHSVIWINSTGWWKWKSVFLFFISPA